MKPVFDDNGLAKEPGNIRCFYFDSVTGEYTGWSDEYINVGVSMPGNSTDIDPGEAVAGKVSLFTGTGWQLEEDHRGETVYSTDTGNHVTISQLGDYPEGTTTKAPSTQFDKWDGSEWVTDSEEKHAANVATAEQQKINLLNAANSKISLWQTELQLGIISDEDKESLIAWIGYIKAVKATDTSTAPDIEWPVAPE